MSAGPTLAEAEVYVVCATGFEECTPMAAYTNESRAEAEAARVRAIRNAQFDGDGAGVYKLRLNPAGPSGFWMAWLNEDGSWDDPYFFAHACAPEIGGLKMDGDGPSQWRGCGLTLEEARRYAIAARDGITP